MLMSIFRLVRPLQFVFILVTYFLGISLARYLGVPFQSTAFWMGLAAVLLAHVSLRLLAEVFYLDVEPLQEGETRQARQKFRSNVLLIALAALALVGFLIFLIFMSGQLSITAFFFFILLLLIVLTYAVPPFRFVNRGFGEFLLAAEAGYVIPSLAFVLQTGTGHGFLMLTLPLALLALTYFIILDFPSFATDRKRGRVTLLTHLGWERVITLHHAFIALAYLLFASAPLFGITLSLLWPVFLSLPFAVFQVWQLRGVALGAPTHWTLLTSTALTTFSLTAYLLALTFWLQ